MKEPEQGSFDWQQQQIDLLDKAIAGLMEHYDTVTVFVTKVVRHPAENGNVTFNMSRGAGNWHARYGQIHEFMIAQKRRIERQMDEEYDSAIDEEEDEDE